MAAAYRRPPSRNCPDVDQRHAHGEILRQTHQRVIDRLIAVGMVFTDDVADRARDLLYDLFHSKPFSCIA